MSDGKTSKSRWHETAMRVLLAIASTGALALASTNLPPSCCDAILMRNVYHHLTEPETFITSVIASLEPGGQLAVVDIPARPGSALPKGVRANREGNGIRSSLVEEEIGSSDLTHVKTVQNWSTGKPTDRSYAVIFRK